MNAFLLFILITCCLLILGWGLKQRSRQIQYPFLAAAVYMGWVVPQLVGLSMTPPYDLPPGALSKTIFMATLCLIALFYGYTLNTRPTKLFWWRFSENRLALCAAILSIFGAYFFFQVIALAEEATAEFRGAWSGKITIYVFLSRSLTIGMIIALVLHMIRPRWTTLIIMGFDFLFYVNRIVIQGRRAALVELGLMLLFALWFYRRWLPPRWLIVTFMVVGALLINSIGDYRKTMTATDRVSWSGTNLEAIMDIDFVGNLQAIATGQRGTEELRNAVMNIEAADELGVYDYGLSLWNEFVFSYIPGQLIGPNIKQQLTINFGNNASSYFNFVPHPGTTLTGFSDAFLSFWYFGALKFFLAGLIMSRWYLAAVKGNIVAQMVLMQIGTDSLQLITHSTGGFYLSFVDMIIFLLPCLIFSRVGALRQVKAAPRTGRSGLLPVLGTNGFRQSKPHGSGRLDLKRGGN